MQPLSPQQARFVEQYLVDPVAARAAERAGYSAKTARGQGSRLLKLPQVQAAIREGEERRAKRVEVKQDDVLRELLVMALARKDVRDGDKLKALELLGRHLKMFTDKIEQTGPSYAELVLGAQRKREKQEAEAAAAASAPEPAAPAGALEASPAATAEPSAPEIDAQPDPAPGRFDPLRYLRSGAA